MLPFVSKTRKEDTTTASISRSYIWQHCKVFYLITIMRLNAPNLDLQSIEQLSTFGKLILDVGDEKVRATAFHWGEPSWIEIHKIEIPQDLLFKMLKLQSLKLHQLFTQTLQGILQLLTS